MKDLKSPICWHIFGIIHRSKRQYEEAIKAYRNAVKWDKTNLTIFRDLSLSMLQVKELDGFIVSGTECLLLKWMHGVFVAMIEGSKQISPTDCSTNRMPL